MDKDKDVKMDESGQTAQTSDSGTISDDYKWEETVDVSKGEV